MKKKKKVFVGLSGGVDSAVSAALLKKEGYEVVGVFMSTWHPDFLPCNEEEERRDAMRVAARLDIPFLNFDFEKIYKKEVADYMISEYRAGRTPNPDVMCNKEVKFGAFLKKVLALGADYVATGHYAGLRRYSKNSPLNPQAGSLPVRQAGDTDSFFLYLLRGSDAAKDQSYFLWTLRQEQLSKVLFPIGHLKKEKVRRLAKKFNLPVAEKKDSQGICFLGEVDLKKFLKHYIKEKKGEILLVPSEVEGGKRKVIGHHDGVFFHTLGGRHGFTITEKSPKDGPYYIVGKDVKKNILIVSDLTPALSKGEGGLPLWGRKGGGVRIKNINWIATLPQKDKNYTAQIRYHGEHLPCRVKILGKEKAEVIFEKPVLAALGQSCVIYDKDVCMGGGVI